MVVKVLGPFGACIQWPPRHAPRPRSGRAINGEKAFLPNIASNISTLRHCCCGQLAQHDCPTVPNNGSFTSTGGCGPRLPWPTLQEAAVALSTVTLDLLPRGAFELSFSCSLISSRSNYPPSPVVPSVKISRSVKTIFPLPQSSLPHKAWVPRSMDSSTDTRMDSPTDTQMELQARL